MLFCVGHLGVTSGALRLRVVECCFASVIRAPRVAPLRLWAVDCCFSWLFCGVACGGAIHDARCRNGICGRPRCVSADAGGASVGLSFCGGRFAAPRRSSGRHKWRPYVCGRLNVVSRRSSGHHKWRPYVCGRLNAVSRRSSGRHKWRPYVCGWLNAVSRRSSGRHKWRPYVCGWLIVVSWVVVGGVTGGCRGKGMGMKKRSRTDVAVSVWLLVVAEARLERTTSRL